MKQGRSVSRKAAGTPGPELLWVGERARWVNRASYGICRQDITTPDLRIEPYGRYWVVRLNKEHLAIVLYRKDALTIAEVVRQLWVAAREARGEAGVSVIAGNR